MISFVSFQSIDPSFSITQGAPGKLSVLGGMDHGTSVALKRAAGIRIDASFRLTHAWIECCNLAPEVKENVLAVTELLSPHDFLQIVGVTLEVLRPFDFFSFFLNLTHVFSMLSILRKC